MTATAHKIHLSISDNGHGLVKSEGYGKDHLIARSKDQSRQVLFAISRGTRHIGLRIAAVRGIATDREGVRVAFYDIAGKRRFRAIDLDWMAEVGGGHNWIEFRWDHLDHPVAPGNLGGIALYTAADDADEDEALLHIWVEEQMAHPKVAGTWTLDRARAWVKNWQRVFADRSHHLQSPWVHEARKTAEGYEIVPVRVLTREKGDILWQLGQEHGPIGPRQFLKTGERLELINPDLPQVPGFLIRVLWGFAPDGPVVTAATGDASAATQRPTDDLFTAGNDGASAKPQGAGSNLRMMPSAKQEVRNQGASIVSREGDLLRVVANAPREKELWESRNLPSWGGVLRLEVVRP